MDYKDYDIEELKEILKYPQDIETGCKRNCDDCLDFELRLIEKAIKDKSNKQV